MLMLDYRHKFAAALLAISLHLAVALALGWQPAVQTVQKVNVGVAKGIGQGGLEIGLASMRVQHARTPSASQPKPKVVEKKEAAKIAKDKAPVVETSEALEATEAIGDQRLPESAGNEGGGVPLTEKNYMSTLQVWLERHKKYPYQARRANIEGTVILYFEIDREGKVLESYIQQSSGYSLLDDAVLDMLRRAQPLPAMPDDMNQKNLVLILPVQFYLR